MFLTEQDRGTLRGLKQWEQILWWLKKFGSITTKDMNDDLGIRAAQRRIKDLKDKHRYNIVAEIKQGVDRWGKKTQYTVYTLGEKAATAGAQLKQAVKAKLEYRTCGNCKFGTPTLLPELIKCEKCQSCVNYSVNQLACIDWKEREE